MYKNVYVKTFATFAKGIDCNEFYFNNVDIADTANFLTIYDKDGTLAFRCRIDEVDKFAKTSN